MSVNEAMADIDRVVDIDEYAGKGLAEALAEAGLFPMYGMPTRVRALYTKLVGGDRVGRIDLTSIDRDLEVAIQEFAPGQELIQDKRVHRAVGYTGTFRQHNIGIVEDGKLKLWPMAWVHL
ncbi:MAG: hypothetical protein AAES65_11010 [Candidatus Thiodiazotropha sp. (ex. Lucinoma kazani)]